MSESFHWVCVNGGEVIFSYKVLYFCVVVLYRKILLYRVTVEFPLSAFFNHCFIVLEVVLWILIFVFLSLYCKKECGSSGAGDVSMLSATCFL